MLSLRFFNYLPNSKTMLLFHKKKPLTRKDVDDLSNYLLLILKYKKRKP